MALPLAGTSPTLLNRPVRSMLQLPIWVYYSGVLLFTGLPVVAFLLLGSHSLVMLTLAGNLYAAGLGRKLLWERLGRPEIPPRAGHNANR